MKWFTIAAKHWLR